MVEWYKEKMYDTTLNSTYRYEVTITTDSPLSNLTLLLPLPGDISNTSHVIESRGTSTISNDTTAWNLPIFGANNGSLLEVNVEYFPPMIEGVQQVTYRFSSVATSSYAVNVTHPWERGFTLQPKYHLPVTVSAGEEGLEYPIAYTYLSSTYVSYEAPKGAMVEITITLTGTNSWYIFRQYHNEFHDTLSASFQGSTKGWQEIEGVLVTGVGDENPFWREVPRRTLTVVPASSLGYTIHEIMFNRPLVSEYWDTRQSPLPVVDYPLNLHS